MEDKDGQGGQMQDILKAREAELEKLRAENANINDELANVVGKVAAHDRESGQMREALIALDGEQERLRTIIQARDSEIGRLSAQAANSSDGDELKDLLEARDAEIAELKLARQADRAEMDAVMEELSSLIGESA